MAERLWWQGGVFYQIYPRSFLDASGDGVGDLEGIRRGLDHLVWLGVDAVWLSPIFPSPMADFGYDVSDYCDVHPVFGNLADFDRLLREAHARGIRVILDWVPNHTSNQHPWFLESRRSRSSPKRDWYVWRDPASDGSPPNNWQSAFGGAAWEWDEVTGQFYLHTHLVEQPDLNWRTPAVERAMHDVLRFWLDRGVDGFRIDVVHKLAKDPALRDNPLNDTGFPGYLGQVHVHDENHPDVHELLRGIRRVLDEYDERVTVGEVYIFDPNIVARYYGRGDQLHLAFNFSFLRAAWSADAFRREIEAFETALPEGAWPDLVLSNHDVPRHASRYDDPQWGEARARLAAMLLLTLRGAPFLYYGEEIGMRNVAIPKERIQDPIGITIHPNVSRDPCRTPMQWEPGPGAGFSANEPWLPLGPDVDGRNVVAQRNDPASLLHLYRDLLALRRATPALQCGRYRSLDAPADVLAYERWLDPDEGSATSGAPGHGPGPRTGEGSAQPRAVVALNFASETRRVSLPGGRVRGGLRTAWGMALPGHPGKLELAPSEGVVLLVEPT